MSHFPVPRSAIGICQKDKSVQIFVGGGGGTVVKLFYQAQARVIFEMNFQNYPLLFLTGADLANV